ncbi:MAG: hypothetical protein ACRD2L_21230, partial [Terriglobia bacterium]
MDMLLSEAQTGEEKLEYFETLPRAGDGVCSDRNCPCAEVPIPHGTGYLYVSKETIEFRRDARTLDDMQKKLEKLEEQLNQFIMMDPELASGVLMCEQGARLRNLDLEVAAGDARRWWESGLIPLRPTPLAGTGLEEDESGRLAEQTERVTEQKAMPANLGAQHARSVSAPSRSKAQDVGDQALCFVCGLKPADLLRPIIVSLKRESRFQEVQVPACGECRNRETGAELRANKIALMALILPIILGVLFGLPDDWLRGALLGFA